MKKARKRSVSSASAIGKESWNWIKHDHPCNSKPAEYTICSLLLLPESPASQQCISEMIELITKWWG